MKIMSNFDLGTGITICRGTSTNVVPLNPFSFSSEHYDSELDLVYYNYRHYSPSLGRFLSRDPIAEQGVLNLYAFVKNATIFKHDILGRSMLAPGAEVWHPGNPEKPTLESSDCAERIIAFEKWVEEESKNLSWIDKSPKCPSRLSCKWTYKTTTVIVVATGYTCSFQKKVFECVSPNPKLWTLTTNFIFKCFSESGHPGGGRMN